MHPVSPDPSAYVLVRPGSRRPPDSVLKWIYAHVFLFAFTIGLGCAVGYISPLLAAAEGYDDRAIDELLISGREDQPFRRTAFGGTLGGLAALALAIHTRRR